MAGGSGTRLASLTKDGRGCVVPKQYCSLRGGRSLLGDALERATALAAEERILVVVARQHEEHWRREFHGKPSIQVVVQPENHGTAAGVLLPLRIVMHRDADAFVTLLAADHAVDDEGTLAAALREAHQDAEAAPTQSILLGIEPDAAETDYGWILPEPVAALGTPGAVPGRTRPIAAFLEKPDQATAAALWARGAVWNSFMIVAKATALHDLYQRQLPALTRAFAKVPLLPASELAKLYAQLDCRDLSRDVLERSVAHLRVRVVPPCGWTDLGTPDRVRRCVANGKRVAGTSPADPADGAPLDLAHLIGGESSV